MTAGHVEQLAVAWAGENALQAWINAAPDGPSPIAETITDYLAEHNPFPDDSPVEVLIRETDRWERATIVERVGVDEWTVEYADDGAQAWRDHSELRPARRDGFEVGTVVA